MKKKNDKPSNSCNHKKFRFVVIIPSGHTFATRGNEYGIDAATLAELLGHAQTSTTMNMYVHSQDEQKRKARNAFNQM